ncbi:MAG: ABC transporter ATP-binding protein [Ruminiclostridium sp.]
MLKRAFALSDQGAKDLNKGIAAVTLYNFCLMIPVGLLMMLVMELLDIISGKKAGIGKAIPLYCLAAIVLFVIVFATQWLLYNKTYTVAYQESANRRIVLAEKLRKLPLSFFGKKNISDLTTTFMGDCTALERTFSNAIPMLFGTIFMFIITSIGLLIFDWRMGLCIVIPVPVAALVIVLARKAQEKAELANLDAKRAAYDGVQEYLDTIQELKASSRETEYLEGLEQKLENVVHCSFKNELAPGASTTAAQFLLRFGLVAVLLVGGYLVIAGKLSIPMFILFLIVAGRIYDPFNSCFMLMAEIFSAQVSIKRMKQIDATPEQMGSAVYNNKGYDIEFKNVVFSYNEEPVLNGISFVAKQGEVTALVGPSGSGKSTAAKLAARFWDADSGNITLGGVDVASVEPEALLKNFAIVFQDVLLFDDTVMENIRLGRRDATDEEVKAAARAAQCEEFINRLPQGYQTNIGENGSALSGGERQRISIARALLKDVPIILLDEATASMDAESETLVQEALSTLLGKKTAMVIAHRMRTVANADKIVVLDNGLVSEQGTPTELMAKGGLYAHMVALQRDKTTE